MATFDKKKFFEELDKVTNVEKIKKELTDLKDVDWNPFDNDDVRAAAKAEANQVSEALVELVVGVDVAAKASGVLTGEDKLQLATEFILNECISLPWYLKPFKGFVNKLIAKYLKGALSAVVRFLNAKIGKVWERSTAAEALAIAEA